MFLKESLKSLHVVDVIYERISALSLFHDMLHKIPKCTRCAHVPDSDFEDERSIRLQDDGRTLGRRLRMVRTCS